MNYAMASTSLAHTYGNITAFMTEFVKGLFPKNYFKTVHISSSIAYRQFNVFQNTNKEFIKKNKPMLIIRPRIDISDNDTFLNNTFLTTRIDDTVTDLDFSNLQPFIEDKEKGVFIRYLLNRLKMSFDITIITETQMEQINQAHFIKNRIRQDRPFFLSTSLESYVPKEFMQMLSKNINVPMYDENNNIKPFLDYVNGTSVYPITYKMKNSSGNDEFFRFYPANLDTILTGLSTDDGSKKGFVSDAFAVNFSLTTEFYTAGLYYYLTTNKKIIEDVEISILNDDTSIIPVFTVSNIYDVNLPHGWNMYTAPMYKVEVDKVPDTMNISSLFNQSLVKTIAYHLEKGIPLSTFIHTTVMKDNTILDPTKGEYKIDFEKMELITYNTNKVSTYRLIIHVNTLYINNLLVDILRLDEER